MCGLASRRSRDHTVFQPEKQGESMPLKRPLSVLVPYRRRNVPKSFAWIDHRIRSQGYLKRLMPAGIGLYLFLVLAADKNGLSCWRLDRIERELPDFDYSALWSARDRLVDLDLIAFRPWHKGERDGCYQVLSVRPPKDGALFDRMCVLEPLEASDP